MAQKYLLSCSCGLPLEIETSQAGQQIICSSCGQPQQVPSLLKIKSLPIAEEKAAELRQRKPQTGIMRQAFFLLGVILLIPATFFLLWALLSSPKPRDVSRKQVYFSFGQTKLFQDSTPIPDFEHNILWVQDEDFNRMSPMELYFHFKTLERGPNFSYNFQENFQALKDAYHIRVAFRAALFALALASIIASFFMPKRDVVVTGWSGSEWK